jgi:YXWGXW repeat-containing protein
MLNRLTPIVGLTMLLGLAYVPAAHADTRIAVSIGAPVVAPVQYGPAYGYVWQPGYYVWTGWRYRWIPGSWVRSPYGSRRWGNDRWERDRRYWNRDRRWERDRRDSERDRRDRERSQRDFGRFDDGRRR